MGAMLSAQLLQRPAVNNSFRPALSVHLNNSTEYDADHSSSAPSPARSPLKTASSNTHLLVSPRSRRASAGKLHQPLLSVDLNTSKKSDLIHPPVVAGASRNVHQDADCYCFNLCDRAGVVEFVSASRSLLVTSPRSPWFTYANAIYKGRAPHPLNLSRRDLALA
eukprot:6190386-Pleurochrysis_carterae.AAC.2